VIVDLLAHERRRCAGREAFGVPEPLIQSGARVPADTSLFMSRIATTALAG
jgi:hypothetical protein